MTYVLKIVDAFGGVRPMATACGKPVSTVQSWKDRGSIPDINKPSVLQAAQTLGLPLGPADFFPAHEATEAEADAAVDGSD